MTLRQHGKRAGSLLLLDHTCTSGRRRWSVRSCAKKISTFGENNGKRYCEDLDQGLLCTKFANKDLNNTFCYAA